MYTIQIHDAYTGKSTTFNSKEDRDEALAIAKQIKRNVYRHVSVVKHGAIVWEKADAGSCTNPDIARLSKSQLNVIDTFEDRGIKSISKSTLYNNAIRIEFKQNNFYGDNSVELSARGKIIGN